ncbi:DUF4279 domain-containing protein [Diaphorobacter sp. HDW4A]|uniref:DUF4279 domain-containing protein n=1 Tax=Diaphorobacter sp. HDW4A TaxID=2714924 RepID=UPI00140E3E63|nr:DUF4279 domain-containing protein [Diaphorobacter sp. HDW4A]QIL79401.1 DUF4279 domain-containing protein [Diaphorobacter sp. HDW4A]
MASISATVRRRIKRYVRRREKMVRNPAFEGTPRLYRFDAALRIAGGGHYHDSIAQITGLSPTQAYRKGERRFGKTPWLEDIWILASPLDGEADIDMHLDWLWNAIAPHKEYFRELISQTTSAHVVLGCFSESPYPFLSVKSESLRLLRELEIGVAFNFTCV